MFQLSKLGTPHSLMRKTALSCSEDPRSEDGYLLSRAMENIFTKSGAEELDQLDVPVLVHRRRLNLICPRRPLAGVESEQLRAGSAIAPAVSTASDISAFPKVFEPYSDRFRLRRSRSNRFTTSSTVLVASELACRTSAWLGSGTTLNLDHATIDSISLCQTVAIWRPNSLREL